MSAAQLSLFAEPVVDLDCARGRHGETRLGPLDDRGGCVNQDTICTRCGRTLSVTSTRKDWPPAKKVRRSATEAVS